MSYKDMLEKYPGRIMEGRKSIEANVLGCLFNDILLLKEYNIKNSDFASDEGKFYYDIIRHLSDKGILEPTDTDIRMLCSEDVIQTYKSYNGFKRIEQFKNIVDVKNFTSYIDELHKRNLYIDLIDDNYDLEKEIKIVKENKTIHISPLDLFESTNMSTEEVLNFLASRLLNKEVVTSKSGVKEHVGQMPKDFLNRLNEGSKMGIMFDSIDVEGSNIKLLPHISREVMGLKKKELTMFGAFVNCGKTTMLTNLIFSLASKGQKVLVITNEMQIDDFWVSFLTYISSNIFGYKKMGKKRVKKGGFSDEENQVLEKALDYFNEVFSEKIIVCSINDSDMDEVEKLTRKYSLSHSIDVLCYDTFKMDYNKNGEVSYKDLIKDSRNAQKLCKDYDLIGLCAIQLSQQYLGNLILDLSMLSGAKQINEVLSNLFMMRSVYNDKELNPKDEKYYLDPFIKYKENGVTKEKKIDVDMNGTYRVIFITKTRDGETFEDSNEAVLCSYVGRTGTFKEICSCRPKRAVINQYNK